MIARASKTGIFLLTLAGLGAASFPALRTVADTNGPGGLGPVLTNLLVSPPTVAVTNAASRVAPTNVPTRATTPATTNAPPRQSGATVRGLFWDAGQTRCSVAGRVLKLPPLEAASAADLHPAWRRTIDFGMNMSQGNSDTLRYSLALNAVRERDQDMTSLFVQGMYGKSDEIKDTENASARARYERQLSKRTYGLGYAEWLTDPIAGTDYRVTAIASPGWHLMRTGRTVLNVEAGAGYLAERKREAEEGFAAGRLAASLECLLNDAVLAWCAGEYIPKFADPSVFFVNAEAGLTSRLARNLHLRLTLTDRYDNAPAAASESNDLLLNVALSLCF